MRYTVSDFLASHEDQVKLVAGAGGLARPIHDVGILDYEFMAGLKERYERDNFHGEQLVLSTFLYAKDDPYLIVEAIKRLVAKDASGLVFKNVLHLPLPEQAVRYANARDFPLFITTSDQAYFDCIVYEVASAAAAMEEAGFSRRAVDALLMAEDPSERRRLALALCPSFGESCSVVWVSCDGPLDPHALASIQRWWHKGPGGGPSSAVIPYDQGVLLVATDQDSAPDPHRLLDYCASMPELPEELAVLALGASTVHRHLDELGEAVCEAWDSAGAAALDCVPGVCYGDLGILRALLPVAQDEAMEQFEHQILDPLRDHDAEHATSLAPTLLSWWEHGQRIAPCAAALGQHPNTVRYRLSAVTRLTGLSWQEPAGAQQLALACTLSRCRELRSLRPGTH